MAVYTDVTDHAVAQFLTDYDVGEPVSLKGIAEGVENSNFLLVTDRAPFILTLYEARVQEADLPFFLGLMQHLAARGIHCPQPVAGRDGQALRRLAGRPAVLVTFLQGLWPREIEVPHCAELGRALAQLHHAGSDFAMTRANDLSVSGWRPLLEASLPRADSVQPGLAAALSAELDFLEAEWPTGLPQGTVHADLFPDNAFFLDGRLTGIIDFYFACTDLLAYDLSVCLNSWCFSAPDRLEPERSAALLRQYHARRPLTPEELEALPILCRGSALRFTLTRLYDWLNRRENALVVPKNPLDFFGRLQAHRQVRGLSDYGWSPR